MTGYKSPFDLALYESPLDKLLRADPVSRLQGIGSGPSLSKTIDALEQASRGIFDSKAFQAATAAQKAFEDIAKPFGGVAEMTRCLSENHEHMFGATNAFRALENARAVQWATVLRSATISDFSRLFPSFPSVISETTKLHEQTRVALGLGPIDSVGLLKNHLGLSDRLEQMLKDTRIKMSVFAGIGDVAGYQSDAVEEAYKGLLGDWHTNFNLPKSFWQDRRVRQRHYRRADVDGGVIEAPPAAAIEVMVESGFAFGDSDETGTVALFSFGDLSVAIRSNSAAIDGHSAIVSFERRLRAFIANKLEAHSGDKWFKQRIHGDIHSKAKATREAALRLGELPAPLIDYTEFGDLKGIILQRNNWDEVFGPVFINRDRFDQDMITLLAIRRPTAHARIVDSTQLVEALFVMRRLNALMDDDGAWRAIANSDG